MSEYIWRSLLNEPFVTYKGSLRFFFFFFKKKKTLLVLSLQKQRTITWRTNHSALCQFIFLGSYIILKVWSTEVTYDLPIPINFQSPTSHPHVYIATNNNNNNNNRALYWNFWYLQHLCTPIYHIKKIKNH